MPRVSVVTATYNRSNVLRYTIESVVAQTFTDWEMLVVGDACTDDTERVVASFNDSRIRFVNLSTNSGEQATPNNEGVRLTGGEFIAYLNHDDLWTRDHLEICMRGVTSADMAFPITVNVSADGEAEIWGACPSEWYDPAVVVPASSWFLRRSAYERVGAWRQAMALHGAPSQDWILRASRAGLRIRAIPRATVLKVGWPRDGYAIRHQAMNEEYATLLRNDERLMQQLVARATGKSVTRTSIPRVFAVLLKNAIRSFAALVGLPPHAIIPFIRFRRRGGMLDHLRRQRGLPPLPRKEGV